MRVYHFKLPLFYSTNLNMHRYTHYTQLHTFRIIHLVARQIRVAIMTTSIELFTPMIDTYVTPDLSAFNFSIFCAPIISDQYLLIPAHIFIIPANSVFREIRFFYGWPGITYV